MPQGIVDRVMQLANQFLLPYKMRGEELIPESCPFCHGGANNDRQTFALNTQTGLFHCKRGSCGAKGSLVQLMKHLGQPVDGIGFPAAREKKTYKLPDTTLYPPTKDILQYFERRRIGAETLKAYKIAADDQGNIVFPFYRDGVLVFVKFRRPYKPREKENKEWQAAGTCPILFGMDLCAFSQPLIITEGQIDALALAEAGATNVVSVPSGSDNLDWIEHCWDWLEMFGEIILFGDADPPGRKMVRDVIRRLGEARCLVVEDYPERPDGTPCKDANEILYYHGADALLRTLESAQPIPIKGVIQLADVIPYDPTTVPRIRTMIPALDDALGGLIEGGLTVFTGKPGDGKSTLAGLL